MVYVTAVHLVGGTRHEHIAEVRWENSATLASGASSRAAMVDYIENQNGDVRIRDGVGYVQVGVVKASPPYIRTYADGKWSNNLLALPQY